MSWLVFLITLPLVWALWTGYTFLVSYNLARQIGLPIVFAPWSSINAAWIIFRDQLIPFVRALPWGLGRFVRYNYIGWGFQDKYHMHQELGGAFVVVSPGRVEIHVADAKAVESIMYRRKDFPKPADLYKPFEILGPNLVTVEGEEWQRHKKITVPPFNERNSKLVWKESLRQAQDMLSWWTGHGKTGVSTIVDDTMKLALHVITCAGFGKSYSFLSRDELESPGSGFTLSYRDAMELILRNLRAAFVLPRNILSISYLLPQKVLKIGHAIQDLNKHLAEMLETEKSLISKRDSGAPNLLSTLIRNSEETRRAEGRGQGLSDREIVGNIFVFSVAGHETTANALTYSILLLAANPKLQEWLSEEINQVLGDRQYIETWEYEKIFPQLKRCLALMFETLRLYGSVPFIPKSTTSQAQPLTIGKHHYIIPPHTHVICNAAALHTLPHYWGADSMVWRPSRWLVSSDTTGSASRTGPGNEAFIEPPKGTFVPWSDGARGCPGKKFAQVEFVAVMSRLFRHHRVRPVMLDGEDGEAVKERILSTLEDSMVKITLRLQNPESVSLIWAKVGPMWP
ncbi:MAG: hypothetical protein M1837_005554 [Sclerophora amabilis]|nr:MAG: hypothetical protein M1837_005554 [Sclerophora amabilis]